MDNLNSNIYKKEALRLIFDNYNYIDSNPQKYNELKVKFPELSLLEYSIFVTSSFIKQINEIDIDKERIEKNNKILSEIYGECIYFEELNRINDEKSFSFPGKIITLDKLNIFRPKSSILIEDILKLDIKTLSDIENGNVKKIHLNYTAECYGWFQLKINEIVESSSFSNDDKKKSIINLLDCAFSENDLMTFGVDWDKNKTIYHGYYNIVQHQEVSVAWFLKIVKENLNESKLNSGFNSLFEYLYANYGFYAHGDEEGLIPNYKEFTEEEINLVHNGVTLKASSYEISCAASILEFINTDGFPEEFIYLEY
jgi:hypothetical protein